jgi:hypothetical protein
MCCCSLFLKLVMRLFFMHIQCGIQFRFHVYGKRLTPE